MSKLAAAKLELAKKDRKEANDLLYKVIVGDEPRVKQLLGVGVNPDAFIDSANPCRGGKGLSDGMSALSIAIVKGYIRLARYLLKAGASTELAIVKSKLTPLILAVQNNNIEMAELLVKWRVKMNAVDKIGATALIHAAKKGHVAMTQFLVDNGADLNVQTVAGNTALHYAAKKGHIDFIRILIKAGVNVDLENGKGNTPAKNAVMYIIATQDLGMACLELLLRFGANAHSALKLTKVPGTPWTEEESKDIGSFCQAIRAQPTLALLADHGGVREKGDLDFHLACDGGGGMCTLRQVGGSAWCGGGGGIKWLREKHGIDGTALLGSYGSVNLVGHTVQVRLRPWQLAALDASTQFVIGSRVVLYGLRSTAMNGQHGVVAGALGAQTGGRYSVRLRGSAAGVQIKASNLRTLVDPGRAVVAGHEVDALQSVVLGGVPGSGANASCNGVYNRNSVHTANGFPVFSHNIDANKHLFCAEQGTWCIGDTPSMVAGTSMGWLAAGSPSPSPIGVRLGVHDGTKLVFDPAITLGTPTWITGTPPEPWIFRDARIESYNMGSHEHKLIFCNHERTSLHLRLDHYQFLDWDVLPLRRAAMLAPRTMVTFLMILNRMEDGRIAKGAAMSPGTPALRVFVDILMCSIIDFPTIFREHKVWKSIMAPPDLIVRGRIEDARRVRAAEAAAEATAAARVRSGKRGGKKKNGKKGGRKR